MVEASLYEHLFPLTTVMKQRVVENFDGDTLNERWNTTNIVGTGTFEMADAVDDGFKISTNAGITNGRNSINFNNKRHYSPTASVLIALTKLPNITDDNLYKIGLLNAGTVDPTTQFAYLISRVGQAMRLRTADASTQTDTSYTPGLDANFRSTKIECRSADVQLSDAGVLKVTKTDRLPTIKLQPVFMAQSIAVVSAKTSHIRYIEVYNT